MFQVPFFRFSRSPKLCQEAKGFCGHNVALYVCNDDQHYGEVTSHDEQRVWADALLGIEFLELVQPFELVRNGGISFSVEWITLQLLVEIADGQIKLFARFGVFGEHDLPFCRGSSL